MKGIAKKMLTPLKVCALLGLAVVSLNAKADGVYIGNPDRPNTIWIPAHCDHGCWNEGYFLKVLNPECVDCSNIVWVDGVYDRNGNWQPAHYELKKYVVVNHDDASHPGFPM